MLSIFRMRVDLNLREIEYIYLKKKYPILKDENGAYYFETSNPYISYGFGISVGLPVELEQYIIYPENYDDSE